MSKLDMNPQPVPSSDADDRTLAQVRRVELAISFVLRAGVLLAMLLIVAGTAVSFARHPELFHSQVAWRQRAAGHLDFPHTLPTVLEGVRHLRGQSLVILGLIVLIATPVLRVAISVLAFLYQRDRKFVLITLVVLILLLLSFVLGKAEG